MAPEQLGQGQTVSVSASTTESHRIDLSSRDSAGGATHVVCPCCGADHDISVSGDALAARAYVTDSVATYRDALWGAAVAIAVAGVCCAGTLRAEGLSRWTTSAYGCS
ncbi:hypothetical protein GCM10009753_75140 [Streptantibioticus ferralitis]